MAAEVQDEAAKHVLVLGDERFECADKLPFTTLVRYADNNLASTHHILRKLVAPEDQERMWDAFEEVGDEEAARAFTELIGTYTDRPTERPRP